ncbi:uncharacterized protein PRCAT00000366001 [Priceomyces carsonii]|uniref:uncharacterized protein n=1 Tax=Priceomyces carsonii TaxID=28549 RepID=UPI002ED9657C|nr:unnamed protein product [Priceomyces carsonii]
MSADDNGSSKRTRASGEVLDFLLQEFENNHNPSPEQRKEISDRTNMSEKAVRIWFQNRRAKMRKFERMGVNNNGASSSYSNTPSHTGSQVSSSDQYVSLVLGIPIEINEKYCFIDCTSLSVGSWQRIKSGDHNESLLINNLVNLSPFTIDSIMVQVDLLVILSKRNFEINYFFSAESNNSKILFRIFYPISSIVTCSLVDNNISKENIELRLSLSHQPKFSVYFFNGVSSDTNQWSICDDFSEGQQVSQAHCGEGGSSTPHVLVGFKNSLQFLNSFILENNQAHASTYHPHVQLSDPSSDGQFSHNLNVWSDNKLDHHSRLANSKGLTNSPLTQFDSDASPISIESNGVRENHGSVLALESSTRDHFTDVFSAHTPDFFPSQTPNSSMQVSINHENLINSPSTNLQSYTHSAYSPIAQLPHDPETEISAEPGSAFDFNITSTNTTNNNSVENSNRSSTPSNHNNQIDSFIDYNSHDS